MGLSTHGAGRLPALDGLRGLAIALVILFHVNLLGAGWIGVQLFFVLSGFLITRLLIELRDGRPLSNYLRTFWGRRVLRIFPAYYLYLALLALAALTVLRADPAAQRALAQLPGAALYVYNWQAMLPGHERTLWLTHFWTLAVEEQFYLLWPFLAYRLGPAGLRRLCLALVLAGPLLRLAIFVAWPLAPPRIYEAVAIATLSQLDAFAIGALVALARPAGRWVTRGGLVLAVAALAAFALGALAAGPGLAPAGPRQTPLVLGYPNLLASWFQFTWGYTAINALAALALLLVVAGRWRGLLERPALQRLGLLSYGLYLLHLPLAHLLAPLAVALNRALGAGPIVATLLWLPLYLVVLLGLATASHVFWERRWLAQKERFFPVRRAAPPRAARL
jgi:peptidoglycan/LPS O-acetylase OafA/YrhL